MKEEFKLNIGLLSISLGNTIIGLFISETVLLKSISFLIASICVSLIPSKRIWNYIIISILFIIIIVYIINHIA